jgi:hypothetical protein
MSGIYAVRDCSPDRLHLRLAQVTCHMLVPSGSTKKSSRQRLCNVTPELDLWSSASFIRGLKFLLCARTGRPN